MSGTIDSIVGNMFKLVPARWKQKAMEYMWDNHDLKMIEHFARRYSVGLPKGERVGSIKLYMEKAQALMDEEYLVSFDTLGEKSKTIEAIEQKRQINFDMADLAEERNMFDATMQAIISGKRFPYAYGPTFSVKPSTFTLHYENDVRKPGTVEHFANFLFTFASRGHKNFGIDVDMEEPYSISDTIRIFSNAKRVYKNIDIVHQTNVDRTEEDLASYFDSDIEDLGVRLCIGIYDTDDKTIWSGRDRFEHENNRLTHIGTMNKKERKRRLVKYAKDLSKEGAYVKIATHDVDVIKHMEGWFNEQGISKDMYEFQGLYNVKPKGLEELHKQLIANKTRVRIYLPFAPTLDDAVFYGIRRACKNHQLLGTFSVGAVGYYAKKVLTLGMCK